MKQLTILLCVAWLFESGLAADEIKTAVGSYEVTRLNEVLGPFEVSANGKYLVVKEENRLYCSNLSDRDQRLGEIEVPFRCEWHLVEDQLVLATTEGWKILNLPDLQELRSVDRPPLVPGMARANVLSGIQSAFSGIMPYRTVDGWIDRGLVYDATASKVVGTLRAPVGRDNTAILDVYNARVFRESMSGKSDRPTILGPKTVSTPGGFPPSGGFGGGGYSVAGSGYGGGTTGGSSAARDGMSSRRQAVPPLAPSSFQALSDRNMGTKPAPQVSPLQVEFQLDGFPFKARLQENRLDLLGYDSISSGLFDIPARSAWSFRISDSALMIYEWESRQATVVQFNDLDFGKDQLRASKRFSFRQPMVELNSDTDWMYRFTDGRSKQVCPIRFAPKLTKSGISFFGNSPSWFEFARTLARVKTELAFNSFLASYREVADAEFERVVGRPPASVPVPLMVMANQGGFKFAHFVWTEISRDELMACSPSLKREIERRVLADQKLAQKEAVAKREALIGKANAEVNLAKRTNANRLEARDKREFQIAMGLFFGLMTMLSVSLLAGIVVRARQLKGEVASKKPENAENPNHNMYNNYNDLNNF